MDSYPCFLEHYLVENLLYYYCNAILIPFKSEMELALNKTKSELASVKSDVKGTVK